MLYVFLGIIAGIFTGLGLGGGSILTLLLTLFFSINQHFAQSTNIIVFIPSAIISIIINIKNNNIRFRISYVIIIFGIIGAIIGAFFSVKLNIFYLRKLFGVFLICISFSTIYSIIKNKPKNIK